MMTITVARAQLHTGATIDETAGCKSPSQAL